MKTNAQGSFEMLGTSQRTRSTPNSDGMYGNNAVYCDIHTKHINTVQGPKAESLTGKAGGAVVTTMNELTIS